MSTGLVSHPGVAAAEAEDRNSTKYRDLINDGYIFQPMSTCTEEPRADNFLTQRISLAIQIAKAACVRGTFHVKN